MSPATYITFQALQGELLKAVDFFIPIETNGGNLLFQRLSDAALEALSEIEKSTSPDPIQPEFTFAEVANP